MHRRGVIAHGVLIAKVRLQCLWPPPGWMRRNPGGEGIRVSLAGRRHHASDPIAHGVHDGLQLAAVDLNHGAIDKVGLGRCQIGHQIRHFLDLGNATERDARRRQLVRLFESQVHVHDLELSGTAVRSRAHPETRVTLAEIADAYVVDEMKMIAAADSIPPSAKTDPETGLGSPYEVYGFGTQVAEVLVDPDTGEVEVSSVWAAHDVGRAISPMGVSQQIDGGVHMGLGFCLMEECVQSGGRMANPDMHGYLIPTVEDTPDLIETIIVEEPYSNGPYGAKGVGEQVAVPTAAAIANAVTDAIGIRFLELPLTPDRIAMALAKAK